MELAYTVIRSRIRDESTLAYALDLYDYAQRFKFKRDTALYLDLDAMKAQDYEDERLTLVEQLAVLMTQTPKKKVHFADESTTVSLRK